MLFRLTRLLSSDFQITSHDGQVLMYPRVIYQDRIILQRKTWYIKKEFTPTKQADESDWAYYLRLNYWRYDLGIPDHVFLIVHDLTRTAEVRPTSNSKTDDRKPQYISFKNPLLTSLFEKSIQRVSSEFTIVEMLPSPEQLLDVDGERRVTEFVIEWYSTGK